MHYRIFPCGESAVTLDLGTSISPESNERILQMHAMIIANPFLGLQEVITSYSSLTLVFDLFRMQKSLAQGQTVLAYAEDSLARVFNNVSRMEEARGATHLVPVCYDPSLAPDLNRLAREKDMEPSVFTQLHHSRAYRVYMIGFLPGFPYMGTLDERLFTERKRKPSKVIAGAVAIAGSQTGIYPFESPGGWNIIGQTPMQLFNPRRNPPVTFNAGEHIQFYPISLHEFREMKKANSHESPR